MLAIINQTLKRINTGYQYPKVQGHGKHVTKNETNNLNRGHYILTQYKHDPDNNEHTNKRHIQ